MATSHQRELPDLSQLQYPNSRHVQWETIDQFVAAAKDDPRIVNELLDHYIEFSGHAGFQVGFECLYIPAILSMGVESFDHDTRRRLASFLIDELVKYCGINDELMSDIMEAACAAFGSEALHVAEKLIREGGPESIAWYRLWSVVEAIGLTTDDESIRLQVEALCRDAINEAREGHILPNDAYDAVETLARLGNHGVRAVAEQFDKLDKSGDFARVVRYLNTGNTVGLNRALGATPIHSWVEAVHAEIYRLDADENDEMYGSEDEWDDVDLDFDDESDSLLDNLYSDVFEQAADLVQQFQSSEPAKSLSPAASQFAGNILFYLMDLAYKYEHLYPHHFDYGSLHLVLGNLFPRYICEYGPYFENVVPVSQAFLRWLDSAGILKNGKLLADDISDWTDDIVAKANDPRLWDHQKSIIMRARKEGVDETNPSEIAKFMSKHRLSFPAMEMDAQSPDASGDLAFAGEATNENPDDEEAIVGYIGDYFRPGHPTQPRPDHPH